MSAIGDPEQRRERRWTRARLFVGGLALVLFGASMFLPFVTDVGAAPIASFGGAEDPLDAAFEDPYDLGGPPPAAAFVAEDLTYRGLFAFLWKVGIGLGNLFFAVAAFVLVARGKRMSPWGSFAVAAGASLVMALVWLTFDHTNDFFYRLHAGYYLWASAFIVLPIPFLLWPRTTTMAPLTLYLGLLLFVSHEIVDELRIVPTALREASAAGDDPATLRRIFFELPQDSETKHDVWHAFAGNPACPADVLDAIGQWAVRESNGEALTVVATHPNTSRAMLREILERTTLQPGLFEGVRDSARARLATE